MRKKADKEKRNMNKKVFIVSSTPRKNGNSEIPAEEFARGAAENAACGEMMPTVYKVV